MRAIVIDHPGAPDVLVERDRPVPEPDANHALVRVHAFGVNRADLLQRRGRYPPPPDAPSDIPGLEYAGTVERLGTGAAGPPPGTRVMGLVGGGAYAEYLVVDTRQLLRVPDALSWTEAAAVPEAFITAFDALERAETQDGEWVLIHAIGSGVGTAALQLARARGARMIGTSRTPAKLAAAKQLGLDVAIDSTTEDFVAAVREATGEGANVVLDLIGGPLFPKTLEAMAPRGRLVLIGLTAGRNGELPLGTILSRRLRIEGTVMRSRTAEEKAAVVATFAERVVPLFAERKIHPIVDRVFAFDDVPDAHRYVEENQNFGKVVVDLE